MRTRGLRQTEEQQQMISGLQSTKRAAKKQTFGSSHSFPVQKKAQEAVYAGVAEYLWPICKFLANEEQLQLRR